VASRRAARELALQALYQLEVLGEEEPSPASLALFWAHFERGADPAGFARSLVEGVLHHREEIDRLLRSRMEHWRLERLSRVDLCLLRLGTWELLGHPEIPASVTLNEAVEIARRFGSEESAAFVNGVLDAVAQQLGKAGLRRAPERQE